MARVQPQTAAVGRRGTFSSGNLPAHLGESERFNIAFREARPACVDACEMVQAEGRKVSADFQFACFGDAAFMRFRANVNRKLRSARHVATDPRDAYHLVFNTNTDALVLSQHAREAVQEPGQVRLISMAEPLDVRSRTDMATLCLGISGARLREHGVNPDDLVLKPLDPANSALCHLRRYMMCLFDADEFESDSVLSAQIETTLIDLATLALDAEGTHALSRKGRGPYPEVGTLSGAKPQGVRYRFAGFELEPRERRLLADGEPVTLTPKVFDTLVLLVEHADHVVSRDELMATLWPRGFVTDHNLAKHIWAIRKALGASCQGDSRFIETVPKLGYRFIEPVERVDNGTSVSAKPQNVSEALGPASGDIALAPAASSPSVAPAQPISSDGDRRMLRRRSTDWALSEALPATTKRRRKHWGAVAALLAIVVVGGVTGGLLAWRSHTTPQHSSTMAPGTAMAIVAFRNLSDNPKDAWLGPALTEMLSTELTASGRMHVVPGKLVRAVRKDLPAPLAGGYAPAGLASLRKGVHADYVISGSYLVSGTGSNAKVRVDLVLQDARSDRNVVQFSQSQPSSGLLKLVANAGTALRTKLGLPAGSGNARQLAAAQPPSTDVARHIGFALDALAGYDPSRARDELLLAVTAAPDYAPARMLLARAWMMLGHRDKALAEIQRASLHVQDLPPEERLQFVAHKHEAQSEWSAAAAVYRKLASQSPHDLDYRLAGIQDLIKAGQLAEADKGVEAAHKLSPPLGNDPRIELAAARIADARGDSADEMKHARMALQGARAMDATGVIADSEYLLGYAYGASGKSDMARKWLQAAYADYRRIGNATGEANSQRRLGWVSDKENHWSDAREGYQRALALYQSIGNVLGQSQTYLALSSMQWVADDTDAALASARRAVALASETGDVEQHAHALAWQAAVEFQDGPSDSTLADFEEAIRLHVQAGDKSRMPWALARYSHALVARGRLDEALAACGQATSVAKTAGVREQEFALLACMDVEVARGNIAAAKDDGGRLLTLARSSDDPGMGDMASLHLAGISIDNSDWRDARNKLTDLARAEDGNVGVEALVQAWLALTENALGDPRARDRAAERARALRQRIGSHSDAFFVDMALARLSGATGQREAAVTELRALARDADTRHWVDLALDARMAAWQLLKQAGDPAADALHDKIEATSRVHGFKWVLARLDGQTPATFPHTGKTGASAATDGRAVPSVPSPSVASSCPHSRCTAW